MKETKEFQLKVRVSKSEKEKILAYCEKHSLSVSDFLRLSIENKLEVK